MAGKREEKRKELQERLITAATQRIKGVGVGGLRARDIAADAGCALGSLYTVFGDLSELVLFVNQNTLADLGQTLLAATSQAGDPQDKLIALAITYQQFARENTHLWLALFNNDLLAQVDVPDWYRMAHFSLLQQITPSLSQLDQGLDEEECLVLAQTLFSAVHGIVSVCLQDWITAVPIEKLEQQLVQFVETQVAGFLSQRQA